MEEIEEAVFNGFCKTLNETRSVFCEFEVQDGRLCLAEADCDYGPVPYRELRAEETGRRSDGGV